jgi:hypothetical protein
MYLILKPLETRGGLPGRVLIEGKVNLALARGKVEMLTCLIIISRRWFTVSCRAPHAELSKR